MNEDIIIIPDVHGRKFWREAVEKYPDADTIFLGDYLDPYPAEGISPEALEEYFGVLSTVRSQVRSRTIGMPLNRH